MKILETNFKDLKFLEFHRFKDERGEFSKLLDGSFFSANNLPTNLKQVNYAVAHKKGSVRGLHYQRPPFAEHKLLTCVQGEIFDVVVDIRKNSKTFLKHFSCHLTNSKTTALVIPPGFAHGYQVLTDSATLLYFHDQNYEPQFEGGFNVSDSALGISWPLPILSLSDRDSKFLNINPSFEGLDL